jgi:hypothetical protein
MSGISIRKVRGTARIGIAVVCFSIQVFAVRSDTILSVLRTNDVAVVSTRIGLFRSTLHTKKWVSVRLPAGVLPGGCLNGTDAATVRIFYSPPKERVSEQSDQCSVGFGLWLSEDLGATWTQVDEVHLFRSLFLHSDHLLFATLRDLSSQSNAFAELELFGGPVMISADHGKTWQKAGDSDKIPGALSLAQCNTNAAHICALGWSQRLYCMEYAPEQNKWTFAPSFMPVRSKVDPAAYLGFNMGSATSPCCYVLRANLENYRLHS